MENKEKIFTQKLKTLICLRLNLNIVCIRQRWKQSKLERKVVTL